MAVIDQNLANAKLDLSQRLLAQLKAQMVAAKTPKTKAALAGMVKTQELIVKARRDFLNESTAH
jgi:hypothetical protein